jgi:hypothetical protein
VTITIFLGRTLQNDTVDGKPLTQALKEVTDGLSGTAMKLMVLLSNAAYIPKEYKRSVLATKQALRRVIMEEMLKVDSEPPTLTSLYAKEINKERSNEQVVDEILD